MLKPARNGLLIAIALNVSAFAIQTPPASVDEAGRTLERCLAEIERLRTTCHSTGEIRSLEGRLKAANDLLAAYKSQIDHLDSVIESSSTSDITNTLEYKERIKAFETRLATEQAEAARLRRDNDHLRRSRNMFLTMMIGAGAALVWALAAHDD